jgi:hypothetical protein
MKRQSLRFIVFRMLSNSEKLKMIKTMASSRTIAIKVLRMRQDYTGFQAFGNSALWDLP